MTRTRKSMKSTLVVWAALTLAACSGGPGGGGNQPGDDDDDDDNNPPATYDSQQAGFAADGMKSSAEESASFYTFDASEAPDPAGGFFGPTSCDPVVSGDVSDPDLDGYPNDATSSFDCSIQTLIIHRGSATVQDTRPNTAAFAFHASAEVETSIEAESVRTYVSATLDADENAGTYTLDATDLEVTTEAGGAIVSITGDSYMSFTPYDAWTPEMGGAFVDGELEVDGAWLIEVTGAASVSAEVDTVEPLVLDPACETQIVSGELLGEADVQAGGTTVHEEFHIVWQGCDIVTADYNGSSVDLP